ncbi:KRI1-like protein [Nymphaea thermarum]|nr:KRI1-like protein [Nymphaea thermarum]
MGLNLFEQNDDVEDISKIKVSKEFACKYDYNKRREDIQRLEELKKKGLAGDSSGSESSSDAETEDDEGLLLPKNDLKFYEALVKVKRNDPSLLQKDVNLFSSDNEDEDDKHEGKKAKEPKKKPLYLKDVVAKHLVENGPEMREDLHRLPPKTYAEELEEYRQAVLDATEDAVDEDGDFFKEKKVKKEADIVGNNEMSKILGECFEPDESAFWRDYLGKKKWICKGDKETLLEEDVGLSEDEKALEEQDRYESEFNFRHEEAPTDQVLGFSRHIEGTVRKKEKVLMAHDKDLNQYVSLKKLAPYRPDEFKIPKHKRYNYKQKILSSIEEGLKDKGSKIKKKSKADQHAQDGDCSKIKKNSKADQHEQDGGSVSQSRKESPQEEPSNGEDPQLSSRAKRRRKQAKLKISQSRLQAYGQIPPKSKKPRKH